MLATSLASILAIGTALAPAGAAPARVQSPDEALAQDAGEYGRAYGVGTDEAVRRLRAQAESVTTTDRLAEAYRGRLAGISIEHAPEYRIVVLLTGSAPVPGTVLRVGDMAVPIAFRTGAAATRDEIIAAMTTHRDAIRAALPASQGMAADARTGELVVMVNGNAQEQALRWEAELARATGVPVRIQSADRGDENLSLSGGARVVGTFPGDTGRSICTTGFVVTDGARTGLVTAAHCPDTLTYLDPEGGEVPLSFAGGWGVGYQDVQVHVSDRRHAPLFYADTAKTAVRRLTGSRARTSTRAGDFVCRRGESAGYSCSEVEFVNYAPPGALCAGPCDPVWITAAGPSCKGGDSGGPVFSGTEAFGIIKGANYGRDGRCNFYYYMSTDYLPTGWSLLRTISAPTAPAGFRTSSR